MGGLVLLSTLAAAAVGCGGDDGGGAGARDDSRPIATMLAALPDDDDLAASVIVNDIDAARAAAGIEPEDDPSDDDVVDELLELTLRSDEVRPLVSTIAGGQSPEVEAWEDELGFTFAQVDRDVTAGLPPDHIQVVDGRFDLDEIDEAVHDDPVWSDELDEDEVDGVTVYSWLDDGENDFERVSPTRQIGESARLAVLADDRLAWAREDDAIEELIDRDESLADREDLAEIAAAMEGAGTISAFLTAAADVDGGDLPGRLDPYPAFGLGGAVDEEGDPLLVLALWHDDEDEAEDNLEALEDLADSDEALGPLEWQDLDVESLDREGRVVLGVFGVDEPSLWSHLVFRADPLVRTESSPDDDADG